MDLNYAGTNVALSPTTEEMREKCSVLVREMLSWPHVSMSHVFGVCALYHRKTMFAMLPDNRTLQSSTAITFRVAPGEATEENGSWQLFEINHRDQMTTALASLEKAYRGSSLCDASPARDAVTT